MLHEGRLLVVWGERGDILHVDFGSAKKKRSISVASKLMSLRRRELDTLVPFSQALATLAWSSGLKSS